jgi:hypothetical protein
MYRQGNAVMDMRFAKNSDDIKSVTYRRVQGVRDFCRFYGMSWPRGSSGIMSQKIPNHAKYSDIRLTSEELEMADDYIKNTWGLDSDIYRWFWIGIDVITVVGDEIKLKYKNYGSIPNSRGMIWAKATSYIPEKKELLQSQNSAKLQILMPSQTQTSTMKSKELSTLLPHVRNNEIDLYVSAAFDYQYGENRKFQWGFIGKYNPESNEVDILETWIG